MSWYSSFLDQLDNENTILEKLSAKAAGNGFTVSSELISSWKITAREVHRLKSLLDSSQNTSNEVGVVFEYEIARRSKRIDLVILYKSLVFCIEFKTGQEDISLQNLRQVEEYALDLRDFHLKSKEKIIIPILATGLQTSRTTVELESLKVNTVGINNLSESIIDSVTSLNSDDKTNLQDWINSPYKPTPNIIEAAKSLYINNTVADIANYGSVNLTQTVEALESNRGLLADGDYQELFLDGYVYRETNNSGSFDLACRNTTTNSTFTGSEAYDACLNLTDPTSSSTSITIEVSIAPNQNGSGNVYVIDGEQKKSLTLIHGNTYTFNHSSSHPLRFSTTSDGIHGGGSEFTSGIDTSSSGVTVIAVTADMPSTLYYYCEVHSGMGGTATTSSS